MKIKKILKSIKNDYKIGESEFFLKKENRIIAINKMTDFRSLIDYSRNNKNNKYVNLKDFSKEDALIVYNIKTYKKNFDIFEFPIHFIIEYCSKDFETETEDNNIEFLKLSLKKIKTNEGKFIKLLMLFKSFFTIKEMGIKNGFKELHIKHVFQSYYIIDFFFELFENFSFLLRKSNSRKLKKTFLEVYSHCIPHIEDLKDRYNPVFLSSENYLLESNLTLLESSYKNINEAFRVIIEEEDKNIYSEEIEIKYIKSPYFNKSFSKNNYSKIDFYHIKKRCLLLSDKIKENRSSDNFDKVYNRNIINIELLSKKLNKKNINHNSIKVLKKYLFKANHNYCIGDDKVSCFFIIMFFYGLGKHLSKDKEYKNCIKESINLIASNFENNENFIMVKKILYSFLTKKEFAFDLRSCIVHPIGIENQLIHIFNLYFFSLINDHFKNYDKDENVAKLNKNNYKDIDIKNNKRKITKKSEDILSLFVSNIFELEEHLFLRSSSKYLINECFFNDNKLYEVHNILFQGLKDSYLNNKDNDKKEELEIKEVCDMLILKDFEKISQKEKDFRSEKKNDKYKNKDYKDLTLRNIIFHKTNLNLDSNPYILKKMDAFNKKMKSSNFTNYKPNKIYRIEEIP